MEDSEGFVHGKSIFMKISNATSANIPIVYAGGDQKRIMKMTELSNNLEFQITDANEVRLDILDKLYITLRIRFLKFEATNITIYTRLGRGAQQKEQHKRTSPILSTYFGINIFYTI